MTQAILAQGLVKSFGAVQAQDKSTVDEIRDNADVREAYLGAEDELC